MSPHRDRRTLVIDVLVTLAILGGGFTGVVVLFVAMFTLDPDGAATATRVMGAIGVLMTTVAVLGLGLLAIRGLGASTWLHGVLAATVVCLLGLAVLTLVQAVDAPSGPAVVSPAVNAAVMALCPTGWPLLVLGVVAAVRLLRGRSSLAPR